MPFQITHLEPRKRPKEGIDMTVTRRSCPDNEHPPSLSPGVIRGIHAVRRLVLALAAFLSALTGLILALNRS
jgi:hypothetical protein